MLKKLLSTAITAAMLASMAVLPAHAASFSEANKTRYYNGLKNGGAGNFEYSVEEKKVLDGNAANAMNTENGEYVTKYKGVGSLSTTINSNRNVVCYKTLSTSRGEKPKYVHFQVYLGVYEDSDRTGLDDLNIIRHKAEDGAGEKAFSLRSDFRNNTEGRAYPNGDGDLIVENHNEDLWSLRSEKDAQEYHKLDFIVDANGLRDQANMTYLFIDGRYAGSNYTTTKEGFDYFYGYSFRVLKDKSINTNTTVEAYFADGFEGHTEYNDTDDYKVCFEDVLQDIGLGDEIDETMIYKTSNLDWYLPDTVQGREMKYTQSGTKSTRVINTPDGVSKSTVTYSDTAATISHTQTDTGAWEEAADLMAFYPYSMDAPRKTGVSYSSYHPRAKYVKFSFDQTLNSGTGTWLSYDMYTNNSGINALQMWNNEGYLVVAVRGGGGNNTLNGEEDRATALIKGTNHFDWILEFHENEETTSEGGIIQYMFCNGKFVGQGKIGTNSLNRLNNIRLSTKSDSNPEITIDNWSMTLYNSDAEYEDIKSEIEGTVTGGVVWEKGKMNYEITEDMESNSEIAVSVCAKTKGGYEPTDATKIITAIYDKDNNLCDIKINQFVPEQTLADETITNVFKYTEDMKTIRTDVWEMADSIKPMVKSYQMDIVKE